MFSPALEVRSLVKRFRIWPGRSRTVLDGIELVLAPGEGLGLVGPNGSGKSTLLAILAGVERASAGEVRVFGRSVDERATRRRIGYVPDGCPFPAELSARAVLDLLGSLHGLARAERRRSADELLARVGLASEARTPLAYFSLGMRRRFALCQALLHRPDLLLLDEPTAGLDAEGTVALDELLGAARARGATVLLATHVVNDLLDHCARAAVLVGGRLVRSGSTAELVADRGQLLVLYRELGQHRTLARPPERLAMLRLSALALRRTLPVWCLASLLLCLCLAARAARGVPLAGPAFTGTAGGAAALASLRALGRQNAWGLLLVFAPLLWLHAARLGAPAANLWLTATSAPRLGLALSLASGCGLACAAAVALTALVSELVAGPATSAWRRAQIVASPAALLLDAEPSVRWQIPAPAHGERLRLWTTVTIGSGPAVTARLTARAGKATSVCEARVAGRLALELVPPSAAPGTLELELELERIGTGALLVLPPQALEVLVPAGSERLIALALGTRVFFFLVSGCALALGLARVLRPALAAGLVLALALGSWTSASAEPWFPLADLARVWHELGSGLVPCGIPPGALVGGLGVIAVGLWMCMRIPPSPRLF